MQDAEAPEYYTIEEASRISGVSPDTIRRRIKQGKLRAQLRTFDDLHGKKERWCIPANALGPQEIVEPLPVRRDVTLPALANAIELAVGQRDEQIIQRISELFKQQNTRLTYDLTEQSTKKNDVIEQQKALIEQLTTDVAALKEEREKKRGFFARLRGG